MLTWYTDKIEMLSRPSKREKLTKIVKANFFPCLPKPAMSLTTIPVNRGAWLWPWFVVMDDSHYHRCSRGTGAFILTRHYCTPRLAVSWEQLYDAVMEASYGKVETLLWTRLDWEPIGEQSVSVKFGAAQSESAPLWVIDVRVVMLTGAWSRITFDGITFNRWHVEQGSSFLILKGEMFIPGTDVGEEASVDEYWTYGRQFDVVHTGLIEFLFESVHEPDDCELGST